MNQNQTSELTSDFFNLSEFEINVSFDFKGQTIGFKFFMRPILSSEEKQARQSFFGLTPEQQDETQHDYNVGLLSSLATRLPENIPFPSTEGDPKTIIKNFFGQNVTAYKKIVAAEVMEQYFRNAHSKEFFR